MPKTAYERLDDFVNQKAAEHERQRHESVSRGHSVEIAPPFDREHIVQATVAFLCREIDRLDAENATRRG
jgi:hypothetical protein